MRRYTFQQRSSFCMLLAGLFLLSGLLDHVSGQAAPDPELVPAAKHQRAIKSFTRNHCYDCHGDGEDEGDFQIDELNFDFTDPKTAASWRDVIDLVRLGEMPPPDADRPTPEELQQFGDAIDSLSQEAVKKTREVLPPLRRLSHSAMDHAVADLLGTTLRLSDGLPADPVVAGFDNLATTMIDSKEFVDALQRNARKIAENVITQDPDPRLDQQFPVARREDIPYSKELDAAILWSTNGRDKTVYPEGFEAPCSGRYRVVITAYQRNTLDDFDRAGTAYEIVASTNKRNRKKARNQSKKRLPERKRRQATLIVADSLEDAKSGKPLSGRVLGTFSVPSEMSQSVIEIDLNAGESFYLFATDCFRLQRPLHVTIDGKRQLAGELLHVRSLQIQGPLADQWPPTATQKLFPNGFDEPLKDSQLRNFLGNAFREPVNLATFDSYRRLYRTSLEQDGSPLSAARQLIEAVLCSPRFMYVRQPQGQSDHYAIASRLSFFLWNSLPDEKLLQLARDEKLDDPEIIEQQVKRMLVDPRHERFVADFTGQWLQLRRVGAMLPDPALFPMYDFSLETSMRRETESLFQHVVSENRPISDLVQPDYAMLNQRLAEHYGIDGVEGDEIRKVDLPAGHLRGGILGHASFLTITSNGTVTSPIVRGIWVLENLLDSPPPPPPPDVPTVEPDVRGASTIREILAKHRDIETCNQCHRRIDPWGFGLENFNPVGKWRERYGRNGKGAVVDASATMPDGKPCDGPAELRNALLEREDRLTYALAAKLLSHATGHPTTISEQLQLESIATANRKTGNRVRDLIVRVSQSMVASTRIIHDDGR